MGTESREKTKAKRSCVRMRKMQLRPGDYHKLKLKTASGGSLTIRYRKTPSLTPGSRSNGESVSGESEASSCGHGCDQSSTANSPEEYQAFEDLEDLLEYSQSCISGAPADACDTVYGDDMQPDFSSYHFWPSDDCNSSDIGSNEILPELLTADSIGIPTVSPVVMNESFLEELAENACPTFEDTHCYTLEQRAMLIQQLKSFNHQGIEVASTLICMETHEHQLADASVWSTNQADHTSLEEAGRLMQESCNFPFTGLPPLLDQTESSEIELTNLPPLQRYETANTFIHAQGSTLHEQYEDFSQNIAAGCVNFKEDAELFDENSFLLLDPGMPDEVNLNVNFSESQSPWSALLVTTLQEVAEEAAIQEQWTAANEAGKNNVAGPLHVKEAFADKLGVKSICKATRENTPTDHGLSLPSADKRSGDQDSLILSGPVVAARGKKLRKKRLRRATPLNTLRSLLSSREELPSPTQHARHVPSSTTETNPEDFCDDKIISSEVKRRSNNTSPAKRFAESSVFNQLDSVSMGRIAHPEKVISRRFNDRHQVSHTGVHVHNSLSRNSRMENKVWTPCTSSEDEMANQPLVTASSQKTYQGSVIASRKQSNQESGKRVYRSDGRSRPKYSSLLPERAVATLRKWFDDHIAFPFADKEQKLDLVSQTGLTLTQVENWLSNYRHRLKVRRSDYEGHVFRPEKAWTRRH